jgi:hypothetical protein
MIYSPRPIKADPIHEEVKMPVAKMNTIDVRKPKPKT